MKIRSLLIVLTILVVGLVTVHLTRVKTKTDYYDLQIEATNKTEEALIYLKQKRLDLNIEIDKRLDPLELGLIGIDAPLLEPSITTTLGSIEAKRTSLNPNFAALIVDYFYKLDLKENDNVAVSFSGSFPALNIAVIIALDTLNINSYIMSSIGASTYGANIVEFNYLEIEKYLYEANIIKRQTNIMSLGGDEDRLANIINNDQTFIDSLYNEYSYIEQIKEPDIQKNIKFRYNLLHDKLPNIKAYVNVGGHIAAMGITFKNYGNGIIKNKTSMMNKNSGLVDYFLNDNIPVIYLLNIIDLAGKNGLETYNEEPFDIGIGDCYYNYQYKKVIIAITLILIIPFMTYELINNKNENISRGNRLKNEK